MAAVGSNEAPLNTILTSCEFAAHLAHLGPACSRFRALHLKGIGAVDTYRLRGIAEGHLESNDDDADMLDRKLDEVGRTERGIGMGMNPAQQQVQADSKSACNQVMNV